MHRHPPWCGCPDCNPAEAICRACREVGFRQEMVTHDLGRTWCCNTRSCLERLEWPVCVECGRYLDRSGAVISGGVLCLDCYDEMGEVGLAELKAELRQKKPLGRRAA